MMAAPPSRSHFELSTTDPGVDLSDPTSTGRNGSKKYSDKHMDGSLRVSSASTETTAASTFVANEEGDQDNMDMSNSHSNSHALLSSPQGLHVDVNQEEELMEEEEDTKVGVASAIYDPKCSTLSLPEFPTHVLESQPHPLQVEPVARLPKPVPEIDAEVLRIAEEINSPKQAPIFDDEDMDKKPAAKPSPNLMDSKRSPSRSPKQSVTFAELPPAAAKAAIQSPDLLDDSQHSSSHNSDEQSLTRPANLNNRQRAKSDGAGTSPIPTPRGRGLRGRRQPQTAADRNNRRKQIMERTSLDGPGNNHNLTTPTASRSKSPLASPNHTPRVSSAPPEPGMVCSPLVATTPRTPASASPAEPNNSNPTLPGDSLLGNKKPAPKSAPAPGDSLLGNRSTPRSAPGDNLAAPGDRMAPRSRSPNGGPIVRPNVRSRVIRPITPPPGSKLANANPPASAYEVAASANQSSGNNDTESSKQRHKNLPSSMKPGAYKEIPGRGLVRNNTLRFDFFAKKKRSLRKLFSSSRRNDWSSVANSQRNLGDTGSAPMDISTQTDGFRNRYVIAEDSNDNDNNNSSSPRSVFRRSASLKSIQSVLVDDSEKGPRTYLGKISCRSLNTAKKGGLSVARPVFQREASTLEALCIIPGDLAVAVALDSDLNGACQVDAEARAEAMKSPPPSPPPPPLPTEKTPAKAARKMFKTAAMVVGTPIKLLKKTPDALKRAPEAIRKTPKAIASTPRRGLGLLKKMRRPRRSYLGSSDPMQKTKSVAKLAVPGASDSATEGAGSAVRRHSF